MDIASDPSEKRDDDRYCAATADGSSVATDSRTSGDVAAVKKSEDRSEDADDHDRWRIALYYHYIDIPDVPGHVSWQQSQCEDLGLYGRVRVSGEGINGVLSGLHESLMRYEENLRRELERNDTDSGEFEVKYCHLRPDLTVQSQLFEQLMVKETSHVIVLIDRDDASKGNRNGRRPNRRRRRKEKRQEQERLAEQGCDGDPGLAKLPDDKQQDMLRYEPAPHLAADEWNEKLLDYMRQSSSEEQKRAILLDVRNVYESRVGHFAVPNVPTVLTNTRKYSDLPSLLASNQEIQNSSEVFMYCTGGVRCEVFSMYLQSMYPDKKLYQLKGGIQNYLKDSTVSDLYQGKNFVFDPRRTDPVSFGSVVGRCLLCDAAHDDYDNGNAPSANKEARCVTCRMLILVCNDCRPGVRCWNDPECEDKPPMYCGKDKCTHEGAAPIPEIVRVPPRL